MFSRISEFLAGTFLLPIFFNLEGTSPLNHTNVEDGRTDGQTQNS